LSRQPDEFSSPRPRGGRILVAEDDRFYRQILARRLEAAGHGVILTGDGVEAWNALQADPPELLLSDWMMPKLDGFDLCRRVKADPVHKAIYCILLTAKDRVEDKVAALDAGADDFLIKPCDDDELLARIRTGLRVHRLYAALEEASVTDSLTGLRNRRYFDRRLEEDVSRCRRYDLRLSLVLVDLDAFKSVNDRFGHPVGDRMLAAAGNLLRRRVRSGEVAARIGGDEFAIILPNTGMEGALAFAEALEEGLATVRLATGSTDAPVLAGSTGCAELLPGWDAATLVQVADQALYARKQERRRNLATA